MKVRLESFGAWVSLDDATLVAIDRALARSNGLDGKTLWDDALPSPPPHPLEAHIAVTSHCPVACSGCYQNASPAGHDVSMEALRSRLDDLANAGVFTVAFGGGEPLSRLDLPDLAREARQRGLVPVVTTSGIGLTDERALTLSDFAQVNVSHDGVSGGYKDVRGFEGSQHADRAIRALVGAGIPVGVNFVLTRHNYDRVRETVMHVRKLGVREIQLLRYKPAGRAASLDYLDRRLLPEQSSQLYPLLEELTEIHGNFLSIRIDCAMIPFLSTHVDDPSSLTRWGVFGCEAGRHLTAVTRDGAISACSFRDAHHAGTPQSGTFDDVWNADADLIRFRDFVASPPDPCRTCAIRSACRGGCKIVSEHLRNDFVPDPECPRVIAFERGQPA